MVEINWTVIVVLLILLFALMGYFKGWWKEAITTAFLTCLVLLSQTPMLAQFFIDAINFVIALLWRLLSSSSLINFRDSLALSLGLETGVTPQLDAGDGYTWIVILILFLALAILIGRYSLPGWSRSEMPYHGYIVTPRGAAWGGLLGALNGWLIISLIRVYLDGSKLPGGGTSAAALTPGGVAVRATDVPLSGIEDSFLPWFFGGLAIFILITAFNTRVAFLKDKDGFRKVEVKPPLGYVRQKITPKTD